MTMHDDKLHDVIIVGADGLDHMLNLVRFSCCNLQTLNGHVVVWSVKYKKYKKKIKFIPSKLFTSLPQF